MRLQLTEEEQLLDRLWRMRFGQPIPVLGCPEMVWAILNSLPTPLRPAGALEPANDRS